LGEGQLVARLVFGGGERNGRVEHGAHGVDERGTLAKTPANTSALRWP
jgi:hypothetical protein